MLAWLSLGLMSLLYVAAGISHFTREKFFLKIVPPVLPYKLQIVWLSGVAEIVLGLALWWPAGRIWAAWGIIVLLVAVSPANIYMLVARRQGKRFRRIPEWTLWLRLVLQVLLIYWAYQFTFPFPAA
ncbi:MAG: DoxX family protein [Microscillaceae bacterium]|nr:DoxX family protein [Microscillaceae bacterium]